jgi:hypothetical protein
VPPEQRAKAVNDDADALEVRVAQATGGHRIERVGDLLDALLRVYPLLDSRLKGSVDAFSILTD